MYKEWLALQQTLKDVLPDSRDNFLHDILKARAVHFDHPAILFSFHVDPVNVSHKLTKEHLTIIIDWLKSFLPSNQVSEICWLIELQKEQRSYADNVIWDSANLLDATLWWESMSPSTTDLKTLAIRVLYSRVFSCFRKSLVSFRLDTKQIEPWSPQQNGLYCQEPSKIDWNVAYNRLV